MKTSSICCWGDFEEVGLEGGCCRHSTWKIHSKLSSCAIDPSSFDSSSLSWSVGEGEASSAILRFDCAILPTVKIRRLCRKDDGRLPSPAPDQDDMGVLGEAHNILEVDSK